MWRDTIDLIPVVVERNGYGEEVETDGEPRTIFANKKSVRQTEFYQALATGIKPEIVFEVQCIEYNDEPKVRTNGKEYHVIRTFSKNGERIELVCSLYPMEG